MLQLSPQREEYARANFKKTGEDPRILSYDVSGAIEGLDELLADFFVKIAQARADYLDASAVGSPRRRGQSATPTARTA